MICRLCKSNDVKELINFGEQPIVHHFIKSKDEYSPKYSFRLGHCTNCDLLQLMDCISPEILYQNYFTLSSWKNQPHVDRLIEVMENISGNDKKYEIFEIGCNDGSFLDELNKRGYLNIAGVEPTLDAYRETQKLNLNVKHDFFGKKFIESERMELKKDIVITRQVLEHIVNLEEFMTSINKILKEDGKLIIEVPDASCNLETLDYTLWEEHVNYFTLDTLKKLVSKYGFKVIHHEVTLFSGRTLTIFCEKCELNVSKNISKDRTIIDYYGNNWNTYTSKLEDFLKKQNKPIAIYGCGGRSSTFVNFTNIKDYIEVYIDDQEEKQNYFLADAKIPIVPWEEKYRNYIILLGVNTENEFKVINKRSLSKENTYSILPPSSLIPEFWSELYYEQ